MIKYIPFNKTTIRSRILEQGGIDANCSVKLHQYVGISLS